MPGYKYDAKVYDFVYSLLIKYRKQTISVESQAILGRQQQLIPRIFCRVSPPYASTPYHILYSYREAFEKRTRS